MADQKISELNAKATLHDTDLVPIVDIEAETDETKKITGANVKSQVLAGHKDLDTGVHGAGAETILNTGDVGTMAAETATDYLAIADLENPPTEDEATKAPTSEWAFDHNAAVLSHLTHPNDNFFSGYGNETIEGLQKETKVPALTAITDPLSMLSVADWYGESGAYRQSDGDSDATHIQDDDANFPDSIRYTLVKWASNAAGDADTGIGVINTVTSSTTLTIAKCSGANFAASYYYWIKHSELIIPVTGLYLITAAVLFLPAEVDKVHQVNIYQFTGTSTPTQLASVAFCTPIVTYSQPTGAWILPLTASQNIWLHAKNDGTLGTPTLHTGAATYNPISVILLKQTA